MSPSSTRPEWLNAPAVERLIRALTANGNDVRFVGGCVRDSLLGATVHDIDIATDAVPQRIIELLTAARIKAIPTGIEHGTVTAVIGEQSFEITTLRRDIATDGRHATVAFGTDWRVDAARRDLTINAMSMTPDGDLRDPFNGADDLAAGCVQFVGDADQRVQEDYLRILRWFRFYAHFGNPPANAEALAACTRFADRVTTVSRERIHHEFFRLLAAPDPLESIRLMVECGVIQVILETPINLAAIGHLLKVEHELDQAFDPVVRLASLLHGTSEIGGLAARLRLSNTEQKRLDGAAAAAPVLIAGASPHDRRVMFYRYPSELIRDRILMQWIADPDQTDWRVWWDSCHSFQRPVFPISGKDVVAVGLGEGPQVGVLLQKVESWWEDQDFAPDRDACLRQLAGLHKK